MIKPYSAVKTSVREILGEKISKIYIVILFFMIYQPASDSFINNVFQHYCTHIWKVFLSWKHIVIDYLNSIESKNY